jgi:hypothetical protein
MSAISGKSPVDTVVSFRSAAITAAHFRERARHYRLAAAVADVNRDALTFSDLAAMFDQIAESFGEAEARQAQDPARWPLRQGHRGLRAAPSIRATALAILGWRNLFATSGQPARRATR